MSTRANIEALFSVFGILTGFIFFALAYAAIGLALIGLFIALSEAEALDTATALRFAFMFGVPLCCGTYNLFVSARLSKDPVPWDFAKYVVASAVAVLGPFIVFTTGI